MHSESTISATFDAREFVSPELRSLPEDTEKMHAIRHELDRDGVVELPTFLTSDARKILKEQVLERESTATATTAAGNRKFALKGEQLRPTVVGLIAESDFILDVANRVLGGFDDTKAWITEPLRREEVIPGVAIMRGPGDVTSYHFDGTYLNIVLPVAIPKISGPRRGQLVIYPNVRSFRRTLWDRKAVPAMTRIPWVRRTWRKKEVDYKEGGAYLFYGYRSYHGVDSPSEPGFRCITNLTFGAPRFW